LTISGDSSRVLGRLSGEPSPGRARVPHSTVDVLLVHCDPGFVAAVTDVVRKHAFTVFSVGSAEEALATVQQGCTPRVALFDLTFPGLDARALLASLRRDPACAETRYVALTTGSGGAAAAALVVDGTLLKPVEVRELLEVLRRHCGAP